MISIRYHCEVRLNFKGGVPSYEEFTLFDYGGVHIIDRINCIMATRLQEGCTFDIIKLDKVEGEDEV